RTELDRVDPDAALAEQVGGAAGHRLERGLAEPVDRAGAPGRDRGDVDDRAAGGHDVGRVAGHLPRRLQVQREQLVELRRIDVEQLGRAPGGDVVDQRVESTERVACFVDRPGAFLV